MNKLDELKPAVRLYRDTLTITKEDGEAALRALRRGVGQKAVSEALNLRRRANLYQLLGTWAIRFASVPEVEGK